MSNVSEWSVTAGLNNSSPPNGWPEGMARSAVNDTAREGMAALARWYQDSTAALNITAGSTTAYTLTTHNGFTSMAKIPLLAFRWHATSTGNVTLNVDGIGAKAVFKSNGQVKSGDAAGGTLAVVAANVSGDWFELIGPEPATGIFDSGTSLIAQQTSAPTGWVKGAVHDNKALRLTTGAASSGGATAFTSVFTSRTIAQANFPNVTFPDTLSVADHSHGPGTLATNDHTHTAGTLAVGTSIANGTGVMRNGNKSRITNNQVGGGGGCVTDLTWNNDPTGDTLSLASGAVSGSSGGVGASIGIGGTTANSTAVVLGSVTTGGSGTPMDFAVQYVDVIIITKS